MEEFKKLEKYAKNTLREASTYADQYMMYKSDGDTELMNLYYSLANIHLDLYNKIHTAMVNEINDYKRVNGKAPENMQIIYNYLHEIEMDLFNDIKAKLK